MMVASTMIPGGRALPPKDHSELHLVHSAVHGFCTWEADHFTYDPRFLSRTAYLRLAIPYGDRRLCLVPQSGIASKPTLCKYGYEPCASSRIAYVGVWLA